MHTLRGYTVYVRQTEIASTVKKLHDLERKIQKVKSLTFGAILQSMDAKGRYPTLFEIVDSEAVPSGFLKNKMMESSNVLVL